MHWLTRLTVLLDEMLARDGNAGMKQVTIHVAKTHLSKLIEAALDGEEVVIARGRKPVVRLVPIAPRPFRIGLLKGELGRGPDFFAPMPDDELELWEGGR